MGHGNTFGFKVKGARAGISRAGHPGTRLCRLRHRAINWTAEVCFVENDEHAVVRKVNLLG